MTLWLTPGRTVLAGELQRQGWCCIPVGAREDLECSGPQALKFHSSQGGAFAAPPKPFPVNWRLERAYCHAQAFQRICIEQGAWPYTRLGVGVCVCAMGWWLLSRAYSGKGETIQKLSSK